MAAVSFRGRNLKGRRIKGRLDAGDETVVLDYNKETSENVFEILRNIVKQDVSKTKKLGYYNAFVRLCYRYGNNFKVCLSKVEILCCLRLGLLHEAKEMRAACLRALRYFCQDAETIDALLKLHIDYFIVRALDISMDNEIERIHSLRLIRKIMHVCPEKFPASLVHVMVSIANDGTADRDKMVRTCLAILCELALQNAPLVCQCRGIAAITKNVLHTRHLPRIKESLLATILYLINHPQTRQHFKAGVDLEQLLAPFTDCHDSPSTDTTPDFATSDEKENRFTASQSALATIMRSWPGLVSLCKPGGSGLQSLLGVLYLRNMETRKEIMNLLYDVFRLTLPCWSVNFSPALLSTDTARMRDEWRLMEGFVAEEGKFILRHLAKTRCNLVDNHAALLLSAFINAGLLEALVEVISTSDDYVSVRATYLLGELQHMANNVMPNECSEHIHTLPELISMATSGEVTAMERYKATKAIVRLNRLHAQKKRGPVPSSLFLDQLMQFSAAAKAKHCKEQPLRLGKDKLRQCFREHSWLSTSQTGSTSSFSCIPLNWGSAMSYGGSIGAPSVEGDREHETITNAIRNSQVTATRENQHWDWELIAAILKWPYESMKMFEDQANQRFVRRLIHFFRPNSRLFSVLELSHENSNKCALVGLHLIDLLLEYDGEESKKLMEEWLADIRHCLAEMTVQRVPANAVFCPSNLMTYCCQYYFLFLGRLSASEKGDKFLENMDIYQQLLNLMTITSHDTYVKLIVSSLDYCRDGMSRLILSKGLTAASETARLYSTKFVRVLLRAHVPFVGSWVMELLTLQLYDQSKAVAMEAISVISEACEEQVNLNILIKLKPAVLHLGHKGSMLLARFLSIPAGLDHLLESNYIQPELEKWYKSFNSKYVQIVEERLNEALTTYEKTYDGSCPRRSHRRQPRKDVFVPIHLYGQLVQHKQGFMLLQQQEYLCEFFNIIRQLPMKTEEQVLKVKAALWAVGHIGTSIWGVGLLKDENIVPEIIKLAEECGVFSVRGTAYYVLGLIASTNRGVYILHELGWEAVKHRRGEEWPVIDEEEEDDSETLEMMLETEDSMTSFGSASDALKTQKQLTPTRTARVRSDSNCETVSSPSFHSSSPRVSFLIDPSTSPAKSPSNIDSSTVMLSSVSVESSSFHSGDQLCTIMEHHSSDSDEDGTRDTRSEKAGSTCKAVEDVSSHHRRSASERRANRQGSHSPAPAVHFKLVDIGKDRRDVGMGDTGGEKGGGVVGNGTAVAVGDKEQPCVVLEIIEERTDCAAKDDNNVKTATASIVNTVITKPRSDSLNTDTTTSGFSSYESGPCIMTESTRLTPIPSTDSVHTDAEQQHTAPPTPSPREGGDIHQPIHPSEVLRKLANLKRIPSLKRRYSNPVLGHVSHRVNVEECEHFAATYMYMPSRGTQGYATLRALQKQRTRSLEETAETEKGNTASLFQQSPAQMKSRSLDFRLGRPNFMSAGLSKSQLGSEGEEIQTLNRVASAANLMRHMTAGGRAEYIGVALPIDVSMMFEVHEGEDERSESSTATKESCIMEACNKLSVLATRGAAVSDNGMEYHSRVTCLVCQRLRPQDVSESSVQRDEGDSTEDVQLISPLSDRSGRSHSNSCCDGSPPCPSSVNGSVESPSRLLYDNSVESRTQTRKEVLKLIVDLSSSVGVKGSEQGLLILKQKFANAFQDACLYSEVCCLLSHYNYRLNARHFIQELFQDVNFDKLFEVARDILDISEGDASWRKTQDTQLEKVSEFIVT